MPFFRKKPVVIEAVQITNDTFDAKHPNPEHVEGVLYDPVRRCVFIETLEGEMRGESRWHSQGRVQSSHPTSASLQNPSQQ